MQKSLILALGEFKFCGQTNLLKFDSLNSWLLLTPTHYLVLFIIPTPNLVAFMGSLILLDPAMAGYPLSTQPTESLRHTIFQMH